MSFLQYHVKKSYRDGRRWPDTLADLEKKGAAKKLKAYIRISLRSVS